MYQVEVVFLIEQYIRLMVSNWREGLTIRSWVFQGYLKMFVYCREKDKIVNLHLFVNL